MTERARADHGSIVGGLHIQMSKLLLIALVAATAATGALIITIAVGIPHPPPPPPGPNGMPPPPPNLSGLAAVSIVTGLFVLSWLAVLVVFSRDQILERLREVRHEPAPVHELDDMFAEFRSQLAADRDRERQLLEERITELTTEYGEQRETDGYLNGLRVATTEEPASKVSSIRRVPRPGV
jgi:hypothetical protein